MSKRSEKLHSIACRKKAIINNVKNVRKKWQYCMSDMSQDLLNNSLRNTFTDECRSLPVPPAIIPTCLAVFMSAGDFLSDWMAKAPVEGELEHQIRQLSWVTNITSDLLLRLTFALVHQETAGASKVNSIIDPEALQELTQLPTLGEFRINIFKVNLSKIGQKRETHLG